VGNQLAQQVMGALDSKSTSSLDSLSSSGDKILEEMKDVEVPEEMVDTHIKAMQFAYYAKNLKDLIQPNADDPLKDIADLSQIKGFISSFTAFIDDAQSKFEKYNIDTEDKTLQKKLKDYGIDESLVQDLMQ
jgi:hypothetical protein